MSLADQLRARIAETGPISVAEFMAECLTHPTLGYYTTRDPLGAGGDFTTAPEISQMFGELIGLALAQTWLDQESPAPFTLAELGPGRGTLMADILRVTKPVPGFHDAARLHLVEASGPLREKQRAALAGVGVTHHDNVAALPDAPLFLVANEFFDALPIRQFVRAGAAWRERLVGVESGSLTFGLGGSVMPEALTERNDVPEGKLVELCSAATAIMAEIEARIAAHGGAVLIVDYGDWRSLGDTLQALRDHQPDDPLAHPGEADLTAHVDFEALVRAAPGLSASRMTPQGVFLERLGIAQRAQALAARLTDKALESHIAAHRRLTHAGEMGTLFKGIAFVGKGAKMVPGFEP